MNLEGRELATVLAALRDWQLELMHDAPGALERQKLHFEEASPLTAVEIDALCEKINCVAPRDAQPGGADVYRIGPRTTEVLTSLDLVLFKEQVRQLQDVERHEFRIYSQQKAVTGLCGFLSRLYAALDAENPWRGEATASADEESAAS